MRALLSTTTLILALLVLGACGDNAPAAAPAPAPKPKHVAAAATPDGGTEAAGEAPQYVYAYNPVGKRDPFRAESERLPTGPGDSTTTAGCSDPLCGYDLEQLVLVGVVSGDANPIAMLRTPDQVGHIVRRNSRVGKQGGKVTAISRDCLVVTEYFATPDGRVNPNKVNICVKQDEALEKTFDLLNNKPVE
jgi:type IV pilus assembly protein PilP